MIKISVNETQIVKVDWAGTQSTGNSCEEKMADASMEKNVSEMSLEDKKAWLWAFTSAFMFYKV